MPPELIAHIYSFMGDHCNCCLRAFRHPNDIRKMYIFNAHHHKPVIYYYCSEECHLFLA
jgi:hypothetical protein